MAGENRILIKSITDSGDEYENVQEFIYGYDMAAEANLWEMKHENVYFSHAISARVHTSNIGTLIFNGQPRRRLWSSKTWN